MSKYKILLNSAIPGQPDVVHVNADEVQVTGTGDLLFGKFSLSMKPHFNPTHGYAMGWWERFELVEEEEDA